MKSIQNKELSIAQKIFRFIGSIFIKGLLTILPITLTIAVFSVSFKLLKGWLHPLYELEPEFLKNIPFSEFLLAVTVILIVGTILNFFFLSQIFHFVESLIFRLPLIRPIYSGIKQLVNAFNPQDNVSFKQVVILEFPRKGIYSIGFMTSEFPADLSPDKTHKYYNVFVPTTPNPTTGFFFLVAQDQIQPINLTRQEAMALIISGGIIQPDRFTQNS